MTDFEIALNELRKQSDVVRRLLAIEPPRAMTPEEAELCRVARESHYPWGTFTVLERAAEAVRVAASSSAAPDIADVKRELQELLCDEAPNWARIISLSNDAAQR